MTGNELIEEYFYEATFSNETETIKGLKSNIEKNMKSNSDFCVINNY